MCRALSCPGRPGDRRLQHCQRTLTVGFHLQDLPAVLLGIGLVAHTDIGLGQAVRRPYRLGVQPDTRAVWTAYLDFRPTINV